LTGKTELLTEKRVQVPSVHHISSFSCATKANHLTEGPFNCIPNSAQSVNHLTIHLIVQSANHLTIYLIVHSQPTI